MIELLVVIAIIGILVALLLPSVQAAREAARRTQCRHQVREIGIGLHNYHDALGSFPVGFLVPEFAPPPETSRSQYRWSVLAQMAPFLEQSNLFASFNFDWPIAHRPPLGSGPFWPYYPPNATAMGTQLAILLCPSDTGERPLANSGPTNYSFCTGDGSNGGEATGANGVFVLGPPRSLGDLRDGSSNTAVASEQLLGIPGPYRLDPPATAPSESRRIFAQVHRGPLDPGSCAAAERGWLLHKGAGWWDGNYLNTLYNHRFPPNHVSIDCITFHNPGWKTARSLHPDGVNLLFADGHVTFIRDSIATNLWSAVSTRAGGEIISTPF